MISGEEWERANVLKYNNNLTNEPTLLTTSPLGTTFRGKPLSSALTWMSFKLGATLQSAAAPVTSKGKRRRRKGLFIANATAYSGGISIPERTRTWCVAKMDEIYDQCEH